MDNVKFKKYDVCTDRIKNSSTDELVKMYTPLVRRIAHHLVMKLPANIQVDDLIQSGMIGLLEAVKKYDQTKGASFETYAGIRIRGSMLDEIRKGDWGPRSVYKNSRRISEAIYLVESRLGRDARDIEVANELNVSLDEYNSMLRDFCGCFLFSFDELFDDEKNQVVVGQSNQKKEEPELAFYMNKFKSSLVFAIENLPEREKVVLNLYYDEEMNLKEIGHILNVSESRVSQIHSQAIHRLRSRLVDWSLEIA